MIADCNYAAPGCRVDVIVGDVGVSASHKRAAWAPFVDVKA
jgi:hypothetical protein